MDVGIDKPRHDRFVAILRDRETRRQQRLTLLPAAEPDDGALVEQQQTVGNVPQAFVKLLRFLHAGGDIKKLPRIAVVNCSAIIFFLVTTGRAHPRNNLR